jgi:hypothetical protein
MVAITVVSGVDYFLNVRRKLEEVSRSREASPARGAETQS